MDLWEVYESFIGMYDFVEIYKIESVVVVRVFEVIGVKKISKFCLLIWFFFFWIYIYLVL